MAPSCPEEPVAAVMASEPMRERSRSYLLKYVVMLVTIVATVTYSMGFNPPGGVWQDTMDGNLAGEPIVRTTNKLRYLVFFYCNALALALSVLVLVLFLILYFDLVEKRKAWISMKPLRALMVLDLVSFMGAYAVGSCRDMLTTVYTSVLMAAGVSTYLTLILQVVLPWPRCLWSWSPTSTPTPTDDDLELEGRLRKVFMLLSTFAVSITYMAGLNSPGGFWDKTGDGHRPGDAILDNGRHKARLSIFFICNSTVFMASLLIIVLLLGKIFRKRSPLVRSRQIFGWVLIVLLGLVGAYAAGSSREPVATAYVVGVVAAGLVCFGFICPDYLWKPNVRSNRSHDPPRHHFEEHMKSPQRKQPRSLLLLLATFATAITYPAGLDPPGGVWQENGNGHLAGDPILSTMNASRYRTFLCCNSFAFAFSLATIIGFLRRFNLRTKMVQTVVVVELFGLIGAYAAGACRDVSTSNAVLALGGAVLFYLVIHVIFFTLDHDDVDFYVDQEEVEKERKLLYLLANLSMALTYQAGLTPPGGFWLHDDNNHSGPGHQAGNPVLLFNHPRRYKAFFYCNSVSFMLSVTTMILLVSPVLYRPAIRSHALTLCTVTGLSCLLGAYAAASTQHLTIPIGIMVVVVVAFFIIGLLLMIFLVRLLRLPRAVTWTTVTVHDEQDIISNNYREERKSQHAERKYLILLGILVAGVTYQAGLDPPGGFWQQNNSDDAGSPVMLSMRRQRYLSFFYSNSTSFAASIAVILLLLLQWLNKKGERLHRWVIRWVVQLDLLALLVAYATGSSREGESSMIIAALAIPIVTYGAIRVMTGFVYPRLRQPQHRRLSRSLSV